MADLQHPDSRSFELVADLYERARPEYPPEAIAWLAEELDLRPGRTVFDLGAGTGKLTRALVETGARVIAVEPGEAMLAQLVQAVPDAEALLGAAEDIPLPDESVDAITMGQSFHWFRHAEALSEMHRVLRPNGGLGLVWNWRDQDAPLQQEISALIAPFVPPGRSGQGFWVKPLEESDLFGRLEKSSFHFVQRLDGSALADRILSISFVAARPLEERRELERRVHEVVEQHGGAVDFPYVTFAFVSRAA